MPAERSGKAEDFEEIERAIEAYRNKKWDLAEEIVRRNIKTIYDPRIRYYQGWRHEFKNAQKPHKLPRAFALWDYRDSAKRKDALGLTGLARLYRLGKGVEKDFKMAYMLLEEASSQGCINAAAEFGDLHRDLHGYKTAFYWYEKAATHKNVYAIRQIGDLYAEGRLGSKDARKAAQYFAEAAKLGDAISQYKLGCCYLTGDGVPKAISEAQTLFDKAVKGGYGKAYYGIAAVCLIHKDMEGYVRNRKKVEDAKYTEEQLILLQKLNP